MPLLKITRPSFFTFDMERKMWVDTMRNCNGCLRNINAEDDSRFGNWSEFAFLNAFTVKRHSRAFSPSWFALRCITTHKKEPLYVPWNISLITWSALISEIFQHSCAFYSHHPELLKPSPFSKLSAARNKELNERIRKKKRKKCISNNFFV